MADDIVTRLRAGELVDCGLLEQYALNATDEIERLQELADLLATKVRHSATCDWMWSSHNPCSCGVSEVRKRYKAVRGE
jgi:hypothetical protein